ncbi:TetR/AcrR family transcriptional regulator [Actinopolymorpha pittospori]|uniref:AcrR family transcriptional regulator n=1 Tax=Actinopolymorpha pittospori TaxID=648752 RepID=A0A927MVA7_9ACTN|nr:TetR/AcrR family transcriptional regulator [Actinopolymorpha pittospori]MBE1607284.1 AcrR family transcriptional regulator [Actinopolymorpha pittospori]
MSELSPERPRRRRRADAERSIAAILDAAVAVLGERPDAKMEEVAAAAGLTRQTLYAHYPSREALLNAVVDRATAEAVAALDAVHLDEGSPTDALIRFLDASWYISERYPLLLRLPIASAVSRPERERHAPVLDRLEPLIRRGQRAGEFDRSLPRSWLLAATVSLAHLAGERVSAGEMTPAEAAKAHKRSVLRLFGVDETRAGRRRG